MAQEIQNNNENSSNPEKGTRRRFSSHEDQFIVILVDMFGQEDWKTISKYMLNRSPRQCRERWFYHLKPDLNDTPWTPEEDNLLIVKQAEIGPRWKKLIAFFPGRASCNIKNRYTVLKYRETHPRFNPEPMSDTSGVFPNHYIGCNDGNQKEGPLQFVVSIGDRDKIMQFLKQESEKREKELKKIDNITSMMMSKSIKKAEHNKIDKEYISPPKELVENMKADYSIKMLLV